MNLNRMDLNLLVVLETIYSEGSLTRAAVRLHLSQPALSHALNRLRDQFGDALFVRQGNRMVPTPRARQLIDPIRRALSTLENALHEETQFDPAAAESHFSLGLRDVLEATSLPPLMSFLQNEAPHIRISSVRSDRKELETELLDGKLDAAIDVLLPLGPEIHYRRISRDRLVVVARKGHPAIKRKNISLAEYLAVDHVLVSSRRRGPGLEDVELAREGLNRNITLRCQHYFAACRVVEQTDLALTMPEQYAKLANVGLKNLLYKLPFGMPTLDVYLYWHSNNEHNAGHKWLRDKLTEMFKSIV